MRKIRLVTIAFALIAIAILLPLRANTAWALPGSGTPSINVLEQMIGKNSLRTDVHARRYYPRRYARRGFQNHVYRNYGRYNWRHHGRRYVYRYPGYNHFYGGFWYASPWWNYGYANDYYDNGGAYGGSSHVEWCLNRYRSYNPRTDTYMGYDGRRHYCRSPY